jgi:hypothetical protein
LSQERENIASHLESTAPAVSSKLTIGTLCEDLLQRQHLLIIIRVVSMSQQLVQSCSLSMGSSHCNGTADIHFIHSNISNKISHEEFMIKNFLSTFLSEGIYIHNHTTQ